MMRRFRRVSDDVVELRLPHAEKALLASMIPQLRTVVTGDTDVEHLRARLFPRAYDDPEREREFQALVGSDLVDQRVDAVDTALATLDGGRNRTRQWVTELDEEQVQSWLSVLHDLRLVLAQIVGIESEADWDRGPDTDAPAELVLWHVGTLQEELLAVLMGGLADT
ncbi:MAG TPA: DUF2017 family protein [Euzebyales bacterium]|nr:DUF2017 family protein [Euzebyales bacterium]